MVSEPFFAKLHEILTTGSLEIGMFLLMQSVSIFRATSRVAFNLVLSVKKRTLKIAGFFALLPFLCNKRPKPSIHHVQS